MRIFIAIELNEEMHNKLAAIQSKLKPAGADVKWVEPQNIHLTLKFLGETPPEKIEKIKNTLDAIAANTNTFNISLSQIGAFPNINSPRVIWVGIKDVGAPCNVTLLASEIENELAKLGFPKEDRPFSAHLTLGRVRSPKDRERLKEQITSSATLWRDFAMTVSTITLFQSTLTPKGPIYTALHKSNLKAT
jgi:2'-5' RNA ligase